MATVIEYALMAGRIYQSTRDTINWLPDLLSQGWIEKRHEVNDASGFEAVAFQKGTEIVISFAGTGSNVDWWANAGGFFGVTSEQLRQAADYYLQVKAANPPDTIISFTGHSLGGGLASLMAVFFGETAVTFDQAPFRNAASEAMRDYLVSALTRQGFSATELAPLSGYSDGAYAQRSSTVTNINVQGEILSSAPATIFDRIGTTTENIANSASGVSGFDLHAQALLTAFLQSQQTAAGGQTLSEVTFKLTDLLAMMFDSNLFANETDPNTNKRNLLDHLVRHEAGNAPLPGGGTITADAMLTRFTSDLWKLAQEGGLTMADGTATLDGPLNFVSKTMIAFAMQKYYDEQAGRVGVGATLFQDVSGGGGIQFDTAAVVGAGQAISTAKGYTQYFQQYLNTTGLFSAEKKQIITSLLPTLRDWYVQAGISDMTATDTLNRGAFLLGGTDLVARDGDALNNRITDGSHADRPSSRVQFFSDGLAHHIGHGQTQRVLFQRLVHHGLIAAAAALGARLERGQHRVIHAHGNARLAHHLGLQFRQMGHIFGAFRAAEIIFFTHSSSPLFSWPCGRKSNGSLRRRARYNTLPTTALCGSSPAGSSAVHPPHRGRPSPGRADRANTMPPLRTTRGVFSGCSRPSSDRTRFSYEHRMHKGLHCQEGAGNIEGSAWRMIFGINRRMLNAANGGGDDLPYERMAA